MEHATEITHTDTNGKLASFEVIPSPPSEEIWARLVAASPPPPNPREPLAETTRNPRKRGRKANQAQLSAAAAGRKAEREEAVAVAAASRNKRQVVSSVWTQRKGPEETKDYQGDHVSTMSDDALEELFKKEDLLRAATEKFGSEFLAFNAAAKEDHKNRHKIDRQRKAYRKNVLAEWPPANTK